MRIRIDAVELPGLTCPPKDPSGAAYRNVHVALQRRDRPADLLDPQPGDAASATWTLECTAVVPSAGGADVKGPYIQGRPGNRFIYLCDASDHERRTRTGCGGACRGARPHTAGRRSDTGRPAPRGDGGGTAPGHGARGMCGGAGHVSVAAAAETCGCRPGRGCRRTGVSAASTPNPESAGSAGWALDELGLNESTFRDGLRRRAGRHRAWRG
ncbi:DUF5990 family protein [Streptomyces tanashiensis]|uniref:DUF5990 family protein n=1 Tax=Streptomyces tanashiensis TaxID=67367 RepID=UPI003F4D37D1